MPSNKFTDSVSAEIIKKRKRVTGRPLIKMEDSVLTDKISRMQKQREVAQSRLIILVDRLTKHEHEVKCREHDANVAGELVDEEPE
jgi:hypothetical protein